MRREAETLTTLHIVVLVVTFEAEADARAYVRETGLPWPLLLDPSRSLFTAYGMRRGGFWDVWGPASWRVYTRLILEGRRLRRPTGDVMQLGGNVLIDPTGIVRMRHVGTGPADRPRVAALLAVVRDTP